MSFFDSILRFSYSRDLHQHLKGLSLDCQGYTGNAIYQTVSLTLLALSFLLMLNYYYGLFNHPRHTRRWAWLINILAACGIAGAVAYFMAAAGLPEDMHCKDIHFTRMDCMLFAATAMLYTFLVCFIFSMLFKWKSVANKKIPF
jgi:hypothetical protein